MKVPSIKHKFWFELMSLILLFCSGISFLYDGMLITAVFLLCFLGNAALIVLMEEKAKESERGLDGRPIPKDEE